MFPFSAKLCRSGFTLIEVVLALGVFFISILALIGLLSPMLKSVDEVEKIDEITSVVNTVNAFLQGSPDIASAGKTKFDVIYDTVKSEDYATIFVFRRYASDTGTDIELAIGFYGEDATFGGEDARISDDDFDNVAGPIFRVVLSASSVTPEESLLNNGARNDTTGVYQLGPTDSTAYPEGYLAMEARIYAENWSENFDPGKLPPHGSDAPDFSLAELLKFEPDFTFNTAIVR